MSTAYFETALNNHIPMLTDPKIYAKLTSMDTVTTLAIELGDFTAGTLSNMIWFITGLLILAGLTYLVIRHNRHTAPDPFE